MSVVLVVEDDPIINLSIVETVENAGFVAIPAFKADQAMTALRQHDNIVALLTDVGLRSDYDGLTLAFQARRLRPAIRLIIATGLTEDEVGEMPSGTVYLGKPFGQAAIEAAVRAAMD